MSPLFQSKIKNGPLTVFEIGGGSVSALVLADEGLPERSLVWSRREPLAFGRHEDFSQYFRDTLKVLDSLLNQINHFHLGEMAAVHCLLASPWHVAESRILTANWPQPLSVTPKIIANMTAQNLARHQARFKSDDFELALIDDVIIKTELDGRVSSNVDGQKASQLAITRFTSSTDRRILQKLREKISPRLHYQDPRFHSNLLSNFAVTKAALPKRQSFILLDVSGELTDVTVVYNDSIRGLASFPMGKYTIARMLAEQLGSNPSEIYSSLKLKAEKMLDLKHERVLDRALEPLRLEWQYLLAETLKPLERPGEHLPVVVIGDDTISLTIGEWAESSTTDRPVTHPTVTDHDYYADLCHNCRPQTKDIPILISSLFANKFLI